MTTPEQSTLGKKAEFSAHYNSDLLFPIPRINKRLEIGLSDQIPFFGFDIWNHYEVSWLNEKGKPQVAIATIVYGCDSKNIIESKSMKLYFNSFNNSRFKDLETLKKTILKDIGNRLNETFLKVEIIPVQAFNENKLYKLSGIYLDELDIECLSYHSNPNFLTTENDFVEETVYSDLLKSNCLVTNQPDWCSIQITYKGKKINHEGLLKYLISFRNDNEFHEQCIEKIYMHIMNYCKPVELVVYGRSTRRGGIDINSYRSSQSVNADAIQNMRLCRQ